MLSAYMLDISVTSQDLWLVSAPCCECERQTGMFTLLSVGFRRVWVHYRCDMHSYCLVKWVWGHSQAQGMCVYFCYNRKHYLLKHCVWFKVIHYSIFQSKIWHFKKNPIKNKYQLMNSELTDEEKKTQLICFGCHKGYKGLHPRPDAISLTMSTIFKVEFCLHCCHISEWYWRKINDWFFFSPQGHTCSASVSICEIMIARMFSSKRSIS